MTDVDVMKDLIGKEFDFFGVDGFRFKLDDIILEAIEDGGDGYRSYLGSIAVRPETTNIFFDKPIARIRVEDYAAIIGYRLIDIMDGHEWLLIGTDNYDDYYPCFMFLYQPKASI